MPPSYTPQDRASLLADVAEMYYLEERGQEDIARVIGVTRSMISRMLKEARAKGIVEARIHRTIRSEHDLERRLIERFGLKDAYVATLQRSSNELVLSYLGNAGAQMVKRYLEPGMTVGLSWGAAVGAMVDAFTTTKPLAGIRVVQLVGAVGTRHAQYDEHSVVKSLADKLGGEPCFLHAPFLCTNRETAEALRQTPGIREAMLLGRQAQLAIVGIGSAWPKYSTDFLAGHAQLQEFDRLTKAGAIGDVCGIYFDSQGHDVVSDFSERSVTIYKRDLLKIPVRIGIAGGPGKAEPVLGALRGRHINVLVTDSVTAQKVLDLIVGK